MLLRASGQAIDEDVEIEATVGRGDGGVALGASLLRFAEAATRGSEGLAAARRALLAEAGPAAFVEAAATVGIFNGLVRVADATGIPLDESTRQASIPYRDDLGLTRYASARNTDLSVPNATTEATPSPEPSR